MNNWQSQSGQAQEAFADGQAALAQGDFAAYGEAQDRLNAAIGRIAAAEAILNPQPEVIDPVVDPEVAAGRGYDRISG